VPKTSTMTVLDVEQSNEDTAKPRRWLGVRHLQFFLLFLSVVVAYGIRTNMSVGIIAMMETDPPDPSIPVSLVASLDPTHHHF
jgi:hypothetical protein